MKLNYKKPLYIKKPSFSDERKGLHLLLWKNLGEWMVVDGDVKAFVDSLEQRFSVSEIINKYKSSEKEVIQILEELAKKEIISHNQIEQEQKQEETNIANITFNITNKCNQSCKWCYNSNRITSELPIEQIINSIDLKNKVFDKNTSFFILGGEPFLDFGRLESVLKYVWKNFKTPPLVSTNGTMFNDEIIKRISGKKIEVQVSLAGTTEKNHDEVCGQSSFKKAINGIKRLTDAKIHTILCMVYTNDTYKNFESYLKMATELQVNEVRFIPMRLIGKGCNFTSQMPNQYEALKHLVNIIKQNPNYKDLLIRDFFTIAMAVCRYSAYRDSCGIGRRVVFIDADGSVYPCPNFTQAEFLCGNLSNDKLSNIVLSSSAMINIRNKFKVDNYSACKKCDFCHWCAGDCRAETISMTGSDFAPSPHCKDLKKLYKEIMWLIADGFKFSSKDPSNNFYL